MHKLKNILIHLLSKMDDEFFNDAPAAVEEDDFFSQAPAAVEEDIDQYDPRDIRETKEPEYNEFGSPIAEFAEEPHDNDNQDDFEEEGDNIDYGDGGEEGEEEREHVAEMGAFGEKGRVSFQAKRFGETEEEQFKINVTKYALTHRAGPMYNIENFNTLIAQYPHPKLLSPEACIAMEFFLKDQKRFEWSSRMYTEHKNIIRCSPSVVFRYINLFNEYYFPMK